MYRSSFKKGLLGKQSLAPRRSASASRHNRIFNRPQTSKSNSHRRLALPKWKMPHIRISLPSLDGLNLRCNFRSPKISIPTDRVSVLTKSSINVGQKAIELSFQIGSLAAKGVAGVVVALVAGVGLVLHFLVLNNPLLKAAGGIFLRGVSKIKNQPVPQPLSAEARGLRLSIIAGGFAVAVIAVIGRLVVLQSGEENKWAKLSTRQYSASVEVEGARGDIVDSQGRLLATSIPTVSVGAHPRLVSNKEDVALLLASSLGLSQQDLLSKFNRDSSFVWLARGLSKNAQATVESLKTPAINAYPSFRRFYPQGTLASPILGRVSRSGKGQAGIERVFDSVLQAEATMRDVRRDAKGRLIDSHRGTEDSIVPISQRVEGASVKLTIDSFAQKILEEEVLAGLEASKAKNVFAVVMDAENGAVLAMAQTKGFDPNSVNGVEPEQLKNMVAEVSFEPGSTMKPLVAAFALQEGVVRADQMMDCEKSGRYRVGRHTVRDAHPVGLVEFPQIIIQSSNICMTKMAEKLGGKALHGVLTDLGFGQATGLELPGEASGILRPLKRWKTIDIATHSFGQGIATTAIQMVRAYGVLANGGYLVEPTLLSEKARLVKKTRVLQPKAVEDMSAMLRRVVEDREGTGKRAAIAGMAVYGKTGTAQKPDPHGRGYLPDAVFSSFLGFVKGQELGLDRSLVMLVAVDEPGVMPRWGGIVAAPVFKQSMERIVAYLLTIESDVRTASLISTKRTDA